MAWILMGSSSSAEQRFVAPKSSTLVDIANCGIVWRRLHIHPTWKENHRIPRAAGQRLYSQWKVEGCECGGNLHCLDHPCLWKGCGLRLPKLQIDGAEEGQDTRPDIILFVNADLLF